VEEQVRFPVGQESVTGWVAASGEPLLVPDVSREPRFVPIPAERASRSELAVPIKTKGAVIGVLNAESLRPFAFDNSDLAVMQSLGNQAAVAIENARLYEQAQELAVVEERQRLARDLHDSVTQALYGIRLYAEAVAEELALGNLDLVAGHLRELRDTSQEALTEMRLLIHELRPPVLAEEGLVAALQARLSAVEGRAGVTTELKAEVAERLAPPLEEGLYRIALEALNNALRHSQAGHITVYLRHEVQQGMVSLAVVDDGIGFDPVAVRSAGGLGLSAMEERAAALGGTLTVKPGAQRGTRVLVEVPI
jgi:signal transduction histidine kinase